MGKKRIIQQTEEELLKEREKIDSKVKGGKEEAKAVEEGHQQKKEKQGTVYIFSSYNNTTITLTDAKGNVLGWSSAGSIGFKGTKKATPFAASKVAEAISQTIQKKGINKVAIVVKGVGSGRDSAIRSLAAKGIEIISIRDNTPVPHNGCKMPKPRRV